MTMLKNSISLVLQKASKGSSYSLCKVEMFGCVKYALHITNDGGSDLEFINSDKSCSEAFFLKAAEYGLSPIHLKDAVNDYLSYYKGF